MSGWYAECVARFAEQLVHDRSHRGTPADIHGILFREAQLALEGVVPPVRAHERTEEDILARIRREPRQKLGDVEAGDLCADRSKLAADLRQRVRLRNDQTHLRRPAVEVDIDDRLARRTNPRGIFGAEHVRDSPPSKAHHALLQKIPPSDATACLGL